MSGFRPVRSENGADERINDYQQCKLREVLAQAQTHGGTGWLRCG
jgi:hypothetical protein